MVLALPFKTPQAICKYLGRSHLIQSCLSQWVCRICSGWHSDNLSGSIVVTLTSKVQFKHEQLFQWDLVYTVSLWYQSTNYKLGGNRDLRTSDYIKVVQGRAVLGSIGEIVLQFDKSALLGFWSENILFSRIWK